ncbi:hypothetical protein C482_15583 [Natrialba chahannaoensis JCM 10990]|uniref:Uncharacterized protein n=1 Tax=Natrialba chahannaoensis JCM 10990 TaxID=1227492 RepID=M0ADU2_9EURY|nr:hypothetical protein C482_15583 [Natrialba chahannaoensis JCM 10990]
MASYQKWRLFAPDCDDPFQSPVGRSLSINGLRAVPVVTGYCVSTSSETGGALMRRFGRVKKTNGSEYHGWDEERVLDPESVEMAIIGT